MLVYTLSMVFIATLRPTGCQYLLAEKGKRNSKKTIYLINLRKK